MLQLVYLLYWILFTNAHGMAFQMEINQPYIQFCSSWLVLKLASKNILTLAGVHDLLGITRLPKGDIIGQSGLRACSMARA